MTVTAAHTVLLLPPFSSAFYFLLSCQISLSSARLFIYNHFFFSFTPPSVWHICCWTLGRLHSALINLFCRSFCVLPPSRLPPTPCCLPLFSQPSLGWHLAHHRVTPPLPSLPPRLISSVPTPSPTQRPLRWDERGAALWLICYVKTLANNRLTVRSQQRLGTDWVKPTQDLFFYYFTVFLCGRIIFFSWFSCRKGRGAHPLRRCPSGHL